MTLMLLWRRKKLFLSTLSLRRATLLPQPTPRPIPNFYPRSPCGERRPGLLTPLLGRRYFYPRSPCGERRVKSFMRNGFFLISIHALLAESDLWKRLQNWPSVYFYPRSPCGERRFSPWPSISYMSFLSTLSLRRATLWQPVALRV